MKYYNYHLSKNEIELCKNSFEYFCNNYVKIPHQGTVIDFNPYIQQIRFAQFIDKEPLLISKAYRNGGWSTLIQIWSIWKCLFFRNIKILILTVSNRPATLAADRMSVTLEHLPTWFPGFFDDIDEKIFDNGNSIHAEKLLDGGYMRGLSHIFMDDIAVCHDSDIEETWKRLQPNLNTGGTCCVSSTPNGKKNWFHRMYTNAQDQISLFKVMPTNYRDHYKDQSVIDQIHRNLGDKTFRSDIECEFI